MNSAQFISAIRTMINISDPEADKLISYCYSRNFKRKEMLASENETANKIFFITNGIIRVTVTDREGTVHTIHFVLENEFIADYSSFLEEKKTSYQLEAIESTQTIVLPKEAIDWGYEYLAEGDKLGRKIAEYYFIYLDNRIKSLYTKSPRERYDDMNKVFPNIINRVPQHMIASYLGITPVHLSRLKKIKS
jgi:CRP-like cAMP-binding protein